MIMVRSYGGAAAALLSLLFAIGCTTSRPDQSSSCTEPKILVALDIPASEPAIFVPVVIGGETYTCLLDTGANETVFGRNLKGKIGKPFMWPKKGKGAHGSTVLIEYFIRLPDIYIGSLNVKDYIALGRVADLQPLSTALNKTVDGIIGMDVLRKYVVQIDFENNKLFFIESHKDRDFMPFYQRMPGTHPQWGKPCRLGSTSIFSGLPTVKGSFVDGPTVEFMIDSGNLSPRLLGTVTHSTFTKLPPIAEYQNIKSEALTIAGMKSVPLSVSVVEDFSVGPFVHQESVFRNANQSTLGLRFLSQFLVTFDFPNDIMYLNKRRDYTLGIRIKIHIPEVGLELVYNGEEVRVESVDPNSVAYTNGFGAGYVLTELNGQSIIGCKYEQFMGLFVSAYSLGANDMVVTVIGANSEEELLIPLTEK